jgi:hypothetical protein
MKNQKFSEKDRAVAYFADCPLEEATSTLQLIKVILAQRSGVMRGDPQRRKRIKANHGQPETIQPVA